MLDTAVLGVPPPPVTTLAAVLWWQLPPANRTRLLWLLSQLVERQLLGAPPSDKEAREETDAGDICG
jgi:hypothetical protein